MSQSVLSLSHQQNSSHLNNLANHHVEDTGLLATSDGHVPLGDASNTFSECRRVALYIKLSLRDEPLFLSLEMY